MADRNDQPFANFAKSFLYMFMRALRRSSILSAVSNALSTRRRLGLLDLPPELRLMIYRYLLVHPHTLDRSSIAPGYRPFVNILRTSRTIHREALDILYRENQFANCLWPSGYPILPSPPQIIDMIQNIYVDIFLMYNIFLVKKFMKYVHQFGNRFIIRGTLTVDFVFLVHFDRPLEDNIFPVRWFRIALGRFTNFRTVELHAYTRGIGEPLFDVLEYLKTALEPVLGYAEDGMREANCLRFHPVDHWNRWGELDGGDWADFLDGIRLEWNENVADTDDS